MEFTKVCKQEDGKFELPRTITLVDKIEEKEKWPYVAQQQMCGSQSSPCLWGATDWGEKGYRRGWWVQAEHVEFELSVLQKDGKLKHVVRHRLTEFKRKHLLEDIILELSTYR